MFPTKPTRAILSPGRAKSYCLHAPSPPLVSMHTNCYAWTRFLCVQKMVHTHISVNSDFFGRGVSRRASGVFLWARFRGGSPGIIYLSWFVLLFLHLLSVPRAGRRESPVFVACGDREFAPCDPPRRSDTPDCRAFRAVGCAPAPATQVIVFLGSGDNGC